MDGVVSRSSVLRSNLSQSARLKFTKTRAFLGVVETPSRVGRELVGVQIQGGSFGMTNDHVVSSTRWVTAGEGDTRDVCLSSSVREYQEGWWALQPLARRDSPLAFRKSLDVGRYPLRQF